MAIKPVLVYRNSDSTADLNSRASRIVDRGIFDGGHVSPSASAMSVDVAPFIAVGYDGIVAISDGTEILSRPAPSAGTEVSYLILHLEYRSLTSSIASLQFITESSWTSSVSKNFFVTFAKFSIDAGATAMTDLGVTIDYSVGDWAEKSGKSGWRSPVANAAALPTLATAGPNLGNRDGDTRITLDTYTINTWNAASETWSPAGGAVDLRESVARGDMTEDQILRSWNGTGLVASTNTATGGAQKNIVDGVDWEIKDTIANRIDIAPVHALINGHFVKTEYTELTLTAPAAGRYDLIYLEVYREVVADVSAETYPNDPTVTGTSTFAQMRTHLEQILERRVTPNIGLSKIEVIDDTTIVATRWRVVSVAGVSTTSINDISAAAVTATNIEANNFGVALSDNDQRVWRALAPSYYDGWSWAIPLVIVRRTLDESAGPPYVEETRSSDNNNRYVYDVAPRADAGMGLAEIASVSTSTSSSGTSAFKSASGFIRGMSKPLVGFSGGITIDDCVIRVKGAELVTVSGSTTVSLPAAPSTGSRRDLVVIEAHPTVHPYSTPSYVGVKQLRNYANQGMRSPQWVGRPVVFDVGSDIDTPAAMVTAGYSPDADDPGVWLRVALDEEDSGPSQAIRAIPVALVHRRNTLTYATSPLTNQNGSTDRPDGLSDSEFPSDKEILDIRHRIVESESESTAILKSSMDKLSRGDLRTRMRPAPLAPDVVGTQTLQVDRVTAASPSGVYKITPAPDGSVSVWGDSDEAILLTAVFPSFNTGGVATPDGSSLGTFNWSSSPGGPGTLIITAPTGYVLNVQPGVTTGPYDGALGSDGVLITTSTTSTGTTTDRLYECSSYTASAPTTDSETNVSSVTLSAVTLPSGSSDSGNVYVQVWARRPSRGRGTIYDTNKGTFEVPDEIHKIEYFDGSSTSEVDHAPIVVQVTATPVANVITIDQAALSTALGSLSTRYATAASNLKMYGVLDVQISDASIHLNSSVGSGVAGDPKVRYIDLLNSATPTPGFDRVLVEFQPGSVSVPVTLTIAFDGDLINRWAVVTPLNRGLRGMYSWSATEVEVGFGIGRAATEVQPTQGVAALPIRNQLVPMVDGGIDSSFIGVTAGSTNTDLRLSSNNDVIVYARNVDTSSPWRAWTSAADRDVTNVGSGTSFYYGRMYDTVSTHVPWESKYSPVASAGQDSSPAFVVNYLVVAPCRVPLESTEELTVYYDMTPYQGLADSYPLQDKTTGTVVDVGDAWLHTLGTNISWIDPRSLAYSFSGVPSTSKRDVGSKFSQGVDFDLSRKIHLRTNASSSLATIDGPSPFRPVSALTRRLPFTDDGVSHRETLFKNSLVVSHEPLTHERVIRPEEAQGDPGATFLYDTGKWTSDTSGQTVIYPVIVPPGSVVKTVVVALGATTGVDVDFVLELVRTSGTGEVVISTDLITVPGSTSLTEEVLYGVEGLDSSQSSSTNMFVRISTTNPVNGDRHVHRVSVFYSKSDVIPGNTRMLVRPYPNGVSTEAPHLHPGAILENTWGVSDFSDLESAYLLDGVDTDGYVIRGKRSQLFTDKGTSSKTTELGDFFYYVPLSDLASAESIYSLGPTTNWPISGSPRDVEMPPSFSGDVYYFYHGGSPSLSTSGDGSTIYHGGVLSYILRNSDNTLTMVVSHSVFGGLAQDDSGSSVVVHAGRGATIDAFYPHGRPIYIKED